MTNSRLGNMTTIAIKKTVLTFPETIASKKESWMFSKNEKHDEWSCTKTNKERSSKFPIASA